MPVLKMKYVLIFLLFSIIQNGWAACTQSGVVYYINGINKPSYKDVEYSSKVLYDSISSFSKNASSAKKVTYLYNHSNIVVDALYTLAEQKAAERNAKISDMFISVGLAAFGLVSPLLDAEQQNVRTLMAGVITAQLPAKTQALVTAFSQRIANESLNNGLQAILVSHSQGNMFANAVYDNIKLTMPANLSRGLGVVNVANPSNRAPSSLYITSNQDLVINLLASVQSLWSLTLPPMAPNFSASAGALLIDFTGHGFNEVYMSQALPTGTTPAKSIAAAVIADVDAAMYRTSTFLDSPSYYIDSNGVKQPRPPGFPADSTSVVVCFPGAVGGV